MSWWMRAKAGDRIVAVKSVTPWQLEHPELAKLLKEGRVYTIRCIGTAFNRACVKLAEWPENVFADARLFKPVEHDRTAAGMAVLRKILDRKRQGETA